MLGSLSVCGSVPKVCEHAWGNLTEFATFVIIIIIIIIIIILIVVVVRITVIMIPKQKLRFLAY